VQIDELQANSHIHRRGPNPPFPGLKETRSRDLTACPVPKNGPLDGRPASSSDFETAVATIRGIPVGRKNQKHPFNLEPLATDRRTGIWAAILAA
jgi:hypothetical protein